MARLKVPDRYVDAFCGRIPRSVLARHYIDYSPNVLKEIYDSANLQVLGQKGTLAICSVCGEALPEDRAYQYYDCGRVYCKECAEKDPTMKRLGICPDCEEAMEGDLITHRIVQLI